MQTMIKAIICITLCVGLTGSNALAGDKNLVKAKIGVKVISGDKAFPAKAADNLRAMDFINIYVIPEKECHVQVISTDRKKVVLLKNQRVTQAEPLVLPSTREHYQPDGESANELFTIICSSAELKEVTALLGSGPATFAQWTELEERLVKNSNAHFIQPSKKPSSIGAIVRGHSRPEWSTEHLPTLSAEPYLIKRYKFNVQK